MVRMVQIEIVTLNSNQFACDVIIRSPIRHHSVDFAIAEADLSSAVSVVHLTCSHMSLRLPFLLRCPAGVFTTRRFR
jgi:hypothetical protein